MLGDREGLMAADREKRNKKANIDRKRASKRAGKSNVDSGTFSNRKRDSLCQISAQCGGCQYLDMTYEKQLAEKQRYVEQLFGGFCKPEPIIGMENPWHYRHKVHAVFKRKPNGEIISGVYEAGSHWVLPVDTCLIENEKADEIIRTIRKLLKSFKITVHNEDTGYGLLRHVLIRMGCNSGQIMVVLVTAAPLFPSRKNFARELIRLHPEITTIVQNINEKKTSMVLGERDIVIYGKGYIEDTLCGKRFRISPQSFYQVNPVQTELLYNKAMEFADLTGKETVLDAYCGTGTIGIIASDRAKRVIGVELNKDAVRDAITNAGMNQVKNVSFYNQDAGKFMQKLAAQHTSIDVVLMDPPRSGSNEAFLSSVMQLAPQRIVYISCGPESLKRDLTYLTKKGMYRVERLVGCDMFPWTEHVEVVCLLSKLKSGKHIDVELDMDELDLTAAESKATYEEIRKYVLEHTGLKVSSLYIAQVKKKCGIIERKNYNKPKSENAKQPQCPPEKEKAIKEALRHFGMI